jgi:hypothetical protein
MPGWLFWPLAILAGIPFALLVVALAVVCFTIILCIVFLPVVFFVYIVYALARLLFV